MCKPTEKHTRELLNTHSGVAVLTEPFTCPLDKRSKLQERRGEGSMLNGSIATLTVSLHSLLMIGTGNIQLFC